MAISGASAWLEKNVSSSESAASIASGNLNVRDSPRESRHVGINKALGCSHLPSDPTLMGSTSDVETTKLLPAVRTKLQHLP